MFRGGRLVAVLSIFVSGCFWVGSPPPSDERMATDTQGLDAVIALFEELDVKEYMGRDDCEQIVYARGGFIGDIEGDICIGNPDLPPMDQQASADHARILEALKASGADTRMAVRIAHQGDVVTSALFFIDGAPAFESYDYHYDPLNSEDKTEYEGELEYTRISDAWWFVWSYFD